MRLSPIASFILGPSRFTVLIFSKCTWKEGRKGGRREGGGGREKDRERERERERGRRGEREREREAGCSACEDCRMTSGQGQDGRTRQAVSDAPAKLHSVFTMRGPQTLQELKPGQSGHE